MDSAAHNEPRPRVFVTQYTPRLAFEEASKWGDVVFMTDKEYRPLPCPVGTNDIVHNEIERAMADYMPGVDYIVTTGSAIPNLLVGSLMREHTRVPTMHLVLKWNNRSHIYELFKVEI